MNRFLLGFRSCACILPMLFTAALLVIGCGSEAPKTEQAQKPAEPVVPEEIQDAAKAFLGSETTVLLFGDLALNGKQEFLAANVVPNTPKKMVAGTAVTRAIVAENDDGKWVELLRADEHLKNQNGYLGLTPLQAVTGWKLQYENSPEKGMALYFTPITSGSVRTIGVKYNPATKRYQSLDINYEKFLVESPSLENPRSSLR
jgi:hypothetical protein